MDKIELLQTMSKVQQELLDIFNDLYSDNRQLIVASNVSLDDILKDELEKKMKGNIII